MNENEYIQIQPETNRYEKALPGVMAGVFLWMFVGLAVSAAAVVLTLTWPPLFAFVLGSEFGFYAMLIVEFALVLSLTAALRKLSPRAAAMLFLLYAFVNGLTLSTIFVVYSAGNITLAFLCTAGMFGFMAAYGALTKADLSGYKGFLMMGLVGIIIATLVNLLLKSDMLDMILCYAGIFIFVGLTAYDTQKLKRMLSACGDEASVKKLRVIGALTLYLDFINIFLRLLQLLGRKGKR